VSDRGLGPVSGQGETAAEPEPEPSMVDLGPLLRRMDELADGLGRLTGQMEELGHQVDQLSEKADRMQKEIDLQANAQASGPPPGDAAQANGPPPAAPDAVASAAPDNNAPALRPYVPQTGILGTLPAGRPAQLPPGQGAEADPKREFDAAMTLLSRAQYQPASEAFRAFADAHPTDDRASAALYWTGDIAYSTKKDYDEAARDFAELLKKYPDAQRAPEGMLKLGLSLFELGQMKEGCAALAALPAKYPDVAMAVATRARTARRDNKCR
jgi:tol-pal system protein YbgF